MFNDFLVLCKEALLVNVTFWAIQINITFEVKAGVLHFGLLFIIASCHAVIGVDRF